MSQKIINYQTVYCPSNGDSIYGGYGDYCFVSPDRTKNAFLTYLREPPFGDAYGRLAIEGRPFPGYVWGSFFAWSTDSRYFSFAWMQTLYDRKTVIADINTTTFCVLTDYIHDMILGDNPLTLTDKKTGFTHRGIHKVEWQSYKDVKHPAVWTERAQYN